MGVSEASRPILIVGSLLAYLGAVSLNGVFNIPGITPFDENIGEISHKYDTGITPSDPTFGMWGLIYTWLLALVVYICTLLCRNVNGTPLYLDPGFIPTSFLVSFIATMISNPLWIYIFLLERLPLAAFTLSFGVLAALACLQSSSAQLENCGEDMLKKGLRADIWAVRIVVQNGMALYAGWVTCATLINVASALVYQYDMSMSTVCTLCLVVLNLAVVGWFYLESFVYDQQLRYVFGHYISFIAALSGNYVKNYDPQVGYTVYCLALLVLTAVLAVSKLAIMIYRGVNNPIPYPPSSGRKRE